MINLKDFMVINKKRMEILKKDSNLKNEIEKFTNTKVEFNDDITIEGESFDVYQAKNVLKAFGRGFSLNDSFYLLEDVYCLEIIDLSEFANSKNRLITLKARIIGTEGKTKKYIEDYTGVKISVFGKTTSILGKWDNVNKAKYAIMKLIEGCMHKTLYKWLEKQGRKDDW